MSQPGRWRRVEAAILVLIAIHSYVVFVLLCFFSALAVRMGGWSEDAPLFFVRQGGVFHFVLATAYLLEYFRRRQVVTLLVAKGTATVFLAAMIALGNDSWVVWVSMLGDACMGLVMLLLRGRG